MTKEIKKELNEKGKIILELRISPKSKESKIAHQMSDGRYKVYLKSAPEKGKANTELTKLLAKEFNLRQADVSIISGRSSKLKKISLKIS